MKSELFTKQACRDAVVVYSLFFSPTTYIYIYKIYTYTYTYTYIYKLLEKRTTNKLQVHPDKPVS